MTYHPQFSIFLLKTSSIVSVCSALLFNTKKWFADLLASFLPAMRVQKPRCSSQDRRCNRWGILKCHIWLEHWVRQKDWSWTIVIIVSSYHFFVLFTNRFWIMVSYPMWPLYENIWERIWKKLLVQNQLWNCWKAWIFNWPSITRRRLPKPTIKLVPPSIIRWFEHVFELHYLLSSYGLTGRFSRALNDCLFNPIIVESIFLFCT